MDDTLGMVVLWVHDSRKIDDPLDPRDEPRRQRRLNVLNFCSKEAISTLASPTMRRPDFNSWVSRLWNHPLAMKQLHGISHSPTASSPVMSIFSKQRQLDSTMGDPCSQQ